VEAQIQKKVLDMLMLVLHRPDVLPVAMNDDKVPAGKYSVSTSTGISKGVRTWIKTISY
jgi:hypothetical protein